MDGTTQVALGDMPSRSELVESGKVALSIVDLVRRGQADALYALLSTTTLRELSQVLGALGALVSAYADQLDAVCIGQGLPVMATDIRRQWLNVLEHASG